jgi:hypothetical protein
MKTEKEEKAISNSPWKTSSVAIQSRWWTRTTSSAWDRGGSFNMALYLRFCEAQMTKDYEEQIEKRD